MSAANLVHQVRRRPCVLVASGRHRCTEEKINIDDLLNHVLPLEQDSEALISWPTAVRSVLSARVPDSDLVARRWLP
jgi:hypothetical protein